MFIYFCYIISLSFRLNEYTEQVSAMRRGLATIVPFQLLSLLSWRELERQVVGGAVDIELLKLNTIYESMLHVFVVIGYIHNSQCSINCVFVLSIFHFYMSH